MADCQYIKENIFAVIDETLPDSVLTKYRKHLVECPNCLKEERDARDFRNALKESGRTPYGEDEVFWKKIWESPHYQEVMFQLMKPEDHQSVNEVVKIGIEFDELIGELDKLYKWPPGWKQIARDPFLANILLKAVVVANNLKTEGKFSSAYLKKECLDSFRELIRRWQEGLEDFTRHLEHTRKDWDLSYKSKETAKKKKDVPS